MKLHMSEAFHDWLSKCPCDWHRQEIEGDEDTQSSTYLFIESSEEINNE